MNNASKIFLMDLFFGGGTNIVHVMMCSTFVEICLAGSELCSGLLRSIGKKLEALLTTQSKPLLTKQKEFERFILFLKWNYVVYSSLDKFIINFLRKH